MLKCPEPIDSLRDQQLVAAARQGDQDAFGELVRRHYKRSLNLATSILRDHGEAEEETQNACWKAFVHLDQFHGEVEFSSWLFRIVRNQCLMVIRRRRGAQIVYLDNRGSNDTSEPIQLPSADLDPEGQFGTSEIMQVLRMEIGRIPPFLRTVIILRDVRQLPIPDLAAQLGITVAAAKSRLLRARVELRKRMERHCARSGARSLMSQTSTRVH
jgi:RNA polymerase sigma-70 factor (ECF subfamily)